MNALVAESDCDGHRYSNANGKGKSMKHVVMFSRGIGSWACAKRVAEKHETENLFLVFTDVKELTDRTLVKMETHTDH